MARQMGLTARILDVQAGKMGGVVMWISIRRIREPPDSSCEMWSPTGSNFRGQMASAHDLPAAAEKGDVMKKIHLIVSVLAITGLVACDYGYDYSQQDAIAALEGDFAPGGSLDESQGSSATADDDNQLGIVSGLTSVGTGFYQPVDGSFSGNGNWLACGAQYSANIRHLGTDFMKTVGSSVFAVTGGTVIQRSGPAQSSGWGNGLYALAIRHEATSGPFVAVYGHINTTLTSGSVVTAGQQIGTIGDYYEIKADGSIWDGSDHLHFGIRPGTTISTPWGRIADSGCTNPSNVNGFVAPVTFLTSNSPAGTDDHGNTTGTATQIGLGSTYSGNIESGGDVDVFRFSTSGSGAVTGFTTSSIDTYCDLLNSSGSVIASDDDSGSGNNCQVTKTGLSSGTYFMRIRHYSSSGTGTYQVRVNFTASSGSSGSTGFTAISVGSSVNASVAQGASMKYSFQMTSGRNYTVRMVPSSGDPDLYTSNSSSISTANWQCRPYLGGTSTETCAFTAPFTGSNYILVQGYTAASYRLSVTSP
jgi:hypothetical protein